LRGYNSGSHSQGFFCFFSLVPFLGGWLDVM